MILMQKAGPSDDARFRAITVDELGDMPKQSLHREPDPRLEAGIEPGVLRLESPLTATSSSHWGSVSLCGRP